MGKRFVVLFAMGVFGALGAFASGAETEANAGDWSYSPPKWSGERITLIEAVEIALANDPNLKLQETAVLAREGAALSATGAFDKVLIGEFSAFYSQEEIGQLEREGLEDQRDQLQKNIDNITKASKEIEDELELLAELRRQGNLLELDLADDTIRDPQFQATLQLIQTLAQSGVSTEELNALFVDAINRRSEALNETLGSLRDAGLTAESQLRKLGEVPTVNEQYQASALFRLAIPYRNGLTLTPIGSFSWEGLNYKDKPKDSELGGQGLADVFRGELGFELDVPILRGRGKDAAAGAQEQSARIDYDASVAALQHQSTVTVVQALVAYWRLVAAQDRLAIFDRSLELQNQIAELSRELIEADELPGVEQPRIDARVLDARARLESAEQELLSARYDLARVIGLEVESDDEAPYAADSFPELEANLLGDVGIDALVARAEERRYDYRSARQLEESGLVLVKAAIIELRPRLDMNFRWSYSALGEENGFENGIRESILDRWVGPSAGIAFDYEKPLGNRVRRGQLMQAEAFARQANIAATDLGRTIRSQILTAFGSLEDTAEQLRLARDSVGYFQQTYDNELEKLRAGLSTVIDLILTEQQWTNSRLAVISAEQQVASFIAQLRFESGTLVRHDAEESVVRSEDLTTPPSDR